MGECQSGSDSLSQEDSPSTPEITPILLQTELPFTKVSGSTRHVAIDKVLALPLETPESQSDSQFSVTDSDAAQRRRLKDIADSTECY